MSLLALALAVTPVCDARAARQKVTQFYTVALVERNVRAGFEAYVDPAFVEHKPDIASGDRAGAIAFLESLVGQLPDARWELLRATGERDLVAVHARFTPAPGAPAYAVADFFRLEDCRIMEHWDVVAPTPERHPNLRSRF